MKKTYLAPTVEVIQISYNGILCSSILSETLDADNIINTDDDMLSPMFNDNDLTEVIFSE